MFIKDCKVEAPSSPCSSFQHSSNVTEHRTKKMTWAEDQLWCLRQGGRSLERYVEEFLELPYWVCWHNAALGACFQMGLDEETIRCDLPTCDFPLVELIYLILY